MITALRADRPGLIRSLVSGLRKWDRENRLFAMFQAAVDESMDGETDGVTTPAFVMGGYVATAEQWEAFTREWEQIVLSRLGNAPAFSMAEANTWSEEKQREIIGPAYRIIEDHVSFGISSAVDPVMLKFYMGDLPDRRTAKRFSNPYHFSFFNLITKVLNSQRHLLNNEKIEFIFDNRSDKKQVQNAWDDFIGCAPQHSKDLLADLDCPRFKNEQDWIPLQAADLICWWLRRRYLESHFGLKKKEVPWKWQKRFPRVHILWTRDLILEFRRLLIEGNQLKFGIEKNGDEVTIRLGPMILKSVKE